MKNRREHADKICSKHPDKLYNITEKYLFRLRLTKAYKNKKKEFL